MAVFFDTHAHLVYPDYEKDFAEVMARARVAEIRRIVCIGTDLESSQRSIELSDRYEEIYAVVGWHPSDVMSAPEDLRPALREMALHPRVVAIGETGLDYYRLPGKPDEDLVYKRRQAEIFEQQLEVASELGLNCVIHQRSALEDTLALAERFAGRTRGVFHCFADDAAAMQRIVGFGSLVSFTGILTFKNGQNIRDTLAATPLDKFMLETDCPFLAPVPYRGKRCEPAHVKEISVMAAEVKGCSLEELSERTCRTAREFFMKMG